MSQVITPASTLILEDRIKLLLALKEAKKFVPKYDQTSVDKLFSDIKEDKKGHMLSLSQDTFGKISFAKSPEDMFNSVLRIKTEFSKYVRNKLEVSQRDITDTTLAKLEENLFKNLAIYSPNELEKKVVIVSGKEIADFLSKKNSSKDYSGGTLQLFIENPEKIKLAIFDGACYALIWYCDNSVKVMDYVYPYGDWMEKSLFSWAKNNHIMTRVEAQKYNLSVTLKNVEILPTLNTFFCGQISDDESLVRLHNQIDWV